MSIAGAWLEDLSWDEAEQRLADGAVAVLPVGAAAKQHGRHLPMNTDWLQARWLARQLVERAPVLVWPILGYGHYPAFTEYPGSVSVPAETLRQTAAAIIVAMVAAGARRALVINTGISTIAPLEQALAAAPPGLTCILANVYDGPRCRAMQARVERQPRGSHADELETSILLAIAPESVRPGRAAPWVPDGFSARLFRRKDPRHPDYSPDGVFGDPTLASADKGKQLLQAMLDDLLDRLAELRAR